MKQLELQREGMLYGMDEGVRQAHYRSKRVVKALNETAVEDVEGRKALVQELFASAGENAYIEPPFRCDYGSNTKVGRDFYCNYDCVFLDCGAITIGDDVMLGPKVALYAVGHPVDQAVRETRLEFGSPITIGDHVWIGGSVVVCPGVTIGSNVIIGAGSVVTKDIPDNVVAVGNPCRVLRPITEEDQRIWEKALEEHRMHSDQPLA